MVELVISIKNNFLADKQPKGLFDLVAVIIKDDYIRIVRHNKQKMVEFLKCFKQECFKNIFVKGIEEEKEIIGETRIPMKFIDKIGFY